MRNTRRAIVGTRNGRFCRRSRLLRLYSDKAQGFVLVIVLVLLAALASVGVATFRAALLELRLVTGLTQKQTMVQLAESAIACFFAQAQAQNNLNAMVLQGGEGFMASCGITDAEIQLGVRTQFCGAASPRTRVATDASILQAHYFSTTATTTTTATAQAVNASRHNILEQGWVVHQPTDPTLLPLLPPDTTARPCQ